MRKLSQKLSKNDCTNIISLYSNITEEQYLFAV